MITKCKFNNDWNQLATCTVVIVAISKSYYVLLLLCKRFFLSHSYIHQHALAHTRGQHEVHEEPDLEQNAPAYTTKSHVIRLEPALLHSAHLHQSTQLRPELVYPPLCSTRPFNLPISSSAAHTLLPFSPFQQICPSISPSITLVISYK
ncbi:unnamed protein product [Protopolystoma xenopodis]|uniref:Uncharacterized protein n=1 Tax=Protopolystoma xenopodis TaxID=117903 RepID=A0A3S4ZNU8_9PLAT|nr:unnamed protein product [Protopolystoma xenopodis]